MAQIKYYLTNSQNLNSISISTGNIIFVEDERKVYMDNSKGKRISYSQVETVDTEIERRALTPTKGVFYFVVETEALWTYQTSWIPLTSSAERQIIFSPYDQFPAQGIPERLYVSGNDIYVWLNGSYELCGTQQKWLDV